MIGETCSHYRVVERLGGGGMGVVYKAEDLRLGRTVALKFLPPELSRDDEAVARFRNEARTASALDHPGICTIHDLDESADGRLFIAMAFCEGETLKRRLTAGPLPLQDALRIARQIAEALAEAHQHGIVHRDIKPANVMVSSQGAVKVVDFGIAKLADSPAFTRTGASIGTPAYMSPEQVRGHEADQRSDLWSLGVVLYEMLAGRPPFGYESSAAVTGAILHQDPPRLESLRPGTPAILVSIVRRLLAKDRAERYSTAAELAEDLRAAERVATDSIETSRAREDRWRRARRPRAMAAAVVAAIALVIAGAVWMRARSSATSRTPAADASAADRSRLEGVTRIAVLPFANLGSAEDEYFAAGMAEEVTSRLAGVNRLAVPSSTTVNGYDRRGKSLHQIGTDLRVDYVVEGAVRWARGSEGSLVRITPKLIRVADDTTVWTQRYDASLSDVFKVQSDIAYQITGALEVALEAHERRSFEARPTANDEAYLAYLRGTATFRGSVRSSDTGRQMQARENLERAVTLDPQFAVAWSWLARVYAAQFRTGAQRTPQTMQAARDAARKAMALDPARPESHLALATVSLVDRDYDGALRELDVAGSSLPNSSDVLGQIGEVERRRGRWAESLTALKRAFNLDPARAAEALAVHYLHMRQYADADHFIGVARAADPLAVTVPEAWALFSGRGDVGGARRVLEAALGAISPEDARVRGLLARLEWFDGRYERALDLIHGMDPAGAWLPGNFRFPAALAAAQVYESMNRRDDAMTSYASAAATLEARWRSAADDYQVEAALGLAYAGLGRAPDAVRHGARAVQLLPVTKDASESPLYMYLLAQIHARLGQSAAAFARLDEMFSVPGFYSVVWVERDPGFARLRAHPRFREYLARWSSQTGDALLPSSARPNR